MQYSQLKLQTTSGFARLHLFIISIMEEICGYKEPHCVYFLKKEEAISGHLFFKFFHVNIFFHCWAFYKMKNFTYNQFLFTLKSSELSIFHLLW